MSDRADMEVGWQEEGKAQPSRVRADRRVPTG